MTIVIEQACVQVRRPRAWPVYLMVGGMALGMMAAVGLI